MKIPPLESKIAITGSTGFLGSHIVRGLFEKGYHNIVALKRAGSKLDLLSDVKEKITWIEGDLLDIVALNALVENAQYVVHSAAKVSYNPKDSQEVYKVNVEGTENVVNACLSNRVTKLLYVSSVAAIGRIKSGVVIDETTEWSESNFNTHYATAKYLAEMQVWRGMVEGLKIGILNPSLILGPSYWGDSSTKLFTHVADGSKIYPTGKSGFVDVRDVCRLLIKLMESEIVNERIIAVSEIKSYHEVFSFMATKLDIKPPSIRIGKVLGALAWRLFWIKRVILGGDPPVTKETVRITSGDFLYDNSKSKNLLDHTYISVEKSIEDTIEKYSESSRKKTSFAYFDKIF